MTNRRPFVVLILASPRGSAVFEKSRLARYLASSFLTMPAPYISDPTELKVPAEVKVPPGMEDRNGASCVLEGFAKALACDLPDRALSRVDPG
jgi:hypothetical protein